jgi:hypothetical protein
MYLAHIPVNHNLRPLYRLLGGAVGVYMAIFGVFGLVEASGLDAFARDGQPELLGQQVNPAGAILYIVLGAVVVVVSVLGRNIDHYVNFWIGHLLLLVGLAMLAFQRTDANVLGHNMTATIVMLILATLLLTASMYTRVGPDRPAADEHAGRPRAEAVR